EFGGFGCVEQWDTEELGALNATGDLGTPPVNEDAASHVPPVVIRSWFHTGALLEADALETAFAAEYYVEPGLTDEQQATQRLAPTVLPDDARADDVHDLARALRGVLLRREVYGEDDTPQAVHPYTVSEQSYTVVLVQPRGPNRYPVLRTHARES